MLQVALTSEAGCNFRCGAKPGRRNRVSTFLAGAVLPAPEPLERLRELVRLVDERRCRGFLRRLGLFLKGAGELFEHHPSAHAADESQQVAQLLAQPLDVLPHSLSPCRACPVAESFWRPSGLTLTAPSGHRLLDFGPMRAVPSGKAWECGAQG